MKNIFASTLWLAASFTTLVQNGAALPSTSRLEARQNNNQGPTPVIGFPGASPIQRQEINTLDRATLSAFIYGLINMMNLPNTNRCSYWQLAAIHGTSRVYDSAPLSGSGYCQHNRLDFAAWHRPYLSLFEYCLQYNAMRWANNIGNFRNTNDQTTHRNAASRLRLPYWDWATNNGQLPSVCTLRDLTTNHIYIRSGNTLRNPLYAYTISSGGTSNNPNGILNVIGGSRPTVETVRAPIVSGNGYASRMEEVNRLMRNEYSNQRNRLDSLFQRVTSYNNFATQGTSSSSTNIEVIHNSAHICLGGSGSIRGHMNYQGQAGFDPAFWLHHCNVDRQFAIWQVINPNSYPTSSGINYTPFRRNSGYHNVLTSRRIQDFGYTYPEVVRFPQSSAMKTEMSRIYGSGTARQTIQQATNGATLNRRQVINDTLTIANTTVGKPTSDTDLSTPADPNKLRRKGAVNLLNDTTTYNEYQALCDIPLAASTGSYSIRFFIGKVTTAQSDWTSDPNYVGSMEAFTLGANSGMTGKMVNPVFLTTAILNCLNRDGNGLTNMRVRNVKKFLEANLNYKIDAPVDVKVDPSKFKITVQTARVKTPKATKAGDNPEAVWGKLRDLFVMKNA